MDTTWLGIRIIDPRSDEILKGYVRIESLRIRQDALIAESLLGPFNDDDDNCNDGIEEEEDVGRKSRHRSSSLLSSVEYIYVIQVVMLIAI